MTMKQTQTKLIKFSDADLDFCFGSKNKFPSCFKKMLSSGYNTQTVANTTIEGNQVTLNYGLNHGYRAGQVIKINTPAIESINKGEFVVDSVTSTSIVLTIDNPPILPGSFTTNSASLGWELVYELNNIHIYKFKHLDDTDMFIRLCFQTNADHTNTVIPSIGKGVDLDLGIIVDEYTEVKGSHSITNVVGVADNAVWLFARQNSAHNNYTAEQGKSTYGDCLLIGSQYHCIFMGCVAGHIPTTWGFTCAVNLGFDSIDYPLLFAATYTNTTFINIWPYTYPNFRLGAKKVSFRGNQQSTQFEHWDSPLTKSAFLPSDLQGFNTILAGPLNIFDAATYNQLGIAYGVYRPNYFTGSYPALNSSVLPLYSKDTEDLTELYISAINNSSSQISALWLCVPIDEVKYV